jgi:hypothetical protein
MIKEKIIVLSSGHVFTGKDLLNAAASPAELMTFGKKLRARLQDSGLVVSISDTKPESCKRTQRW